jgi:hypothetical protein
MQQLGDVVDVDMAALVEHNREGIGRGIDDRRRGRRNHTLGEDRAWPRRVGLEIVVLDRGDQPAVGIVEEWAARFGRRCVSRTSPVSGSSLVETIVVLIGPKARTKFDQAMRSLTCAGFHGRSSSWAFSTSRTASRIGISLRMM